MVEIISSYKAKKVKDKIYFGVKVPLYLESSLLIINLFGWMKNKRENEGETIDFWVV